MFYKFMRWYLRWMIKLHFRRVYIKGTGEVPNGQPAIFASNHPAGFVEPMILATSVRQPIHFLVLGSFLQSPYLQWLFRGLKMVPIYRRDIAGDQSIEKNKSTFQYVHEALERNSHILIYPEAHTSFLYQVRPLKKGIARMSRGFLEGGSHQQMYIVPVGVNFLFADRYKSDVFVHIGKAIKLEDVDNEERPWLKKVVEDTREAMKKVVFDLKDESRQEVVQELVQIKHFDMTRSADIMGPVYVKQEDYVQSIRDYVSGLNELSADQFKLITEHVKEYIQLLGKKGIKERTIKMEKKGMRVFILLLLGFPFFLVGMLLNAFSFISGIWIKRNLVKRIEYKAGVSATVPAILTLIFSIVSFILGLTIHWLFFLLVFAFPLGFYFFITYLDLLDMARQITRWSKLNKEVKEDILAKRNWILEATQPS